MLKRLLSLVLAALIAVPTPALPAQVAPPSIERSVAHAARDAAPALPRLAQRLSDTIPPLYMLGGDDKIAPVASFNAATDAFPSAALSFSTTSLGYIFDSAGKWTTRPNNLLTYSNTFNNAAWSTSTATITSGVSDPLGGTNAWTLTATGAGALLYQNVTIPTSANGLFAVYVKRRTGSGTISLRQPAGAYSAVTITSSWTQVSVVGPGNGAVNIAIQIATNGDAIDIYAATVSAVTYETTPRTDDQVITTSAAYYGPRIDYDPNTLAVKGLLIEEARTNLAIQSGALTNAAWTATSTTAATNSIPDPSGLMSSTTQTATANANNLIFQTVGASLSASTYTLSVFIKQNTSGWMTIEIWTGVGFQGAQLWVNTATGAVGSSAATAGFAIVGTPSSRSIGNGWYRYQITATVPAATAYICTRHVDADGGFAFTATNTKSAYVYGPQLELGSFPTSYIPTAATSVTRAADVVQFNGAALAALQGSSFTAIGEAQTISTTVNSFASIIGLSAGAVILGQQATANNIAYLNLTSGNVTANFPSGNTASPYRIAAATNGSASSLVVNGGTVSNAALGIYTRAGGVYLGSWGFPSGVLNGWIKSFAIYNQRLSDATLQAKSVVGASYAANDNGVRFAFANDNLPVHWRIAL